MTKIRSKWSVRKKLLIAFLVLGFLIIPAGIFTELYEAYRTLHQYGDVLIAKQYDRAYGMTTQESRASTSYSTFLKVRGDLNQRMGDLKSIEVRSGKVEEQSEGWFATFEANVEFTRDTLPFVFVLKKENHSWKIYSYREQ